ncbi:MAG: methyltransferase [Alphaproteobacteria bacterium]|nr:methyltransferase [Alphaproteobacteria bacterium]MBY0501898.1 methyltransferase [Alphaproteobacteria bacterium]
MGKNIYLSTFISGFSPVVEEIIKKKIKDIEIIKLSDGAILYKTKKLTTDLKNIAIFNNTFLVLQYFQFSKETSFQHVIDLILKFPKKIKKNLKFSQRTFKVFFSNENRFIKVDPIKRSLLTNFLSKNFKLANKKSSQQFNEFWLAKRTGNFFALMLRITDNKANPEKGELRPELASFFVYLSEPTQQDIVWDPFAGSGSIPLNRIDLPFKKLYISDNNQKNVDLIKEKLSCKKHKFKQHITTQKHDFIKGQILNENCNKIITDPPWGLHQSIENVQEFYCQMFKKFSESLVKGGLLIILVSREVNLQNIFKTFNDKFKLITTLEILVSGKKAIIYKLCRI